MHAETQTDLHLAEKGAKLSIITYIIISILKIMVGQIYHSSALFADGVNNLTDVISSVTILIGLILARRPADKNHPYGHWKIETIASLITSFIMMYIGIQVLWQSVVNLMNPVSTTPDILSAVVALISGLVMIGVYMYNNNLAKRANSLGLKATAKDNLSDALTSFSVFLALVFSYIGLPWLDRVMAVLVGIIICKTAFEIFNEATFMLTDGFDEAALEEYRQTIEALAGVHSVESIRARLLGANVYVDVTIRVNPELTVVRSHYITEKVEQALADQHNITYTDIHVEPNIDEVSAKNIRRRLKNDKYLN